jgi:hypothetical protein
VSLPFDKLKAVSEVEPSNRELSDNKPYMIRNGLLLLGVVTQFIGYLNKAR